MSAGKPSDEMIDSVIKMRQGLADYAHATEMMLEMTKLKARQYHAVFEQLTEAGFSDQQALELLKARGENL